VLEESRVEKLIELFERAVDMPRARRTEFVEQACGDDAALGLELRSLLEAHASAPDYFDELAEKLVTPAYTAIRGAPRQAGGAVLLQQVQAALGNSYHVLRELGGGMSRVFLAEEMKLGRKVVIKVLPPEMAASASAERFRREIQLAAQLQHPHIVPLLTSNSADSFLYYTMPFVAGESLRARLARDGPLPVRDARDIWRDVLDALAHAHASGVIHRDIKPGNILLAARNALVSDFGIARAIEAAGEQAIETTPGLTIGTPAYMAPEQVTGDKDADHRVDIYAAGLVMYEMLEGRLPFSSDSTRELILARLTRDPTPISRSDCPPNLASLVMQCLEKAPGARPQSAEFLLAELEAIDTGHRTAQPPRPRRVLQYSLAALALAAAMLGGRELLQDRPPPGSAAAAATADPSIAVLPLTNLSADPADAVLADGMTEELISMLSRLGTLRVIPSTSVYALKDQRMDLRQIAESLRVSHVLEGGVQKVGQRLRLQARLVDARDGSTRWSETYDREMGDIFAVQAEISAAVTRELDVRLSGREASGRSSVRRYTPSIEAYEWYLRGMDLALMRSAAGRQQSVDYFNRAIAADSNFAAAYAGLAHKYLAEAGAAPGNQRESLARAERVARKAVALDDSLAEAHVALGWVRSAQRDWASAEAELKLAIALDPRAPRAFEGLARVYVWTGPPSEQLAAAQAGLNVDPFSHSAIREMAISLSMNGRCDEAIERLRPLKALSPPAGVAGVIMGQCYAAKAMWREAIAEFRWAMETSDARAALSFLGYALARAGHRDEAKTILSDLLAGRKYSHGAFGIASVYAGLGDFDKAFVWFDKSMDENSVRVYLMGPMFADLQRDPRFARLKKRMGL
jgi:eukaryotic-like serine/threonine-protein kinase